MTKLEFLQRKIELKKQHVQIIQNEIEDLEAEIVRIWRSENEVALGKAVK